MKILADGSAYALHWIDWKLLAAVRTGVWYNVVKIERKRLIN